MNQPDYLNTISPVDGRYARITAPLAPFFSEHALFKYRVRIEVEYFIALCELPIPQLADADKKSLHGLRNVFSGFNEQSSNRIKEIESTTNHDVKAVEYFVKENLQKTPFAAYTEFIHFGLTSQDINNTAIPLLLKEAVEQVLLPELVKFCELLFGLAKEWKDVPMLSRTHGQPASPTRLGKEMMVFYERITKQVSELKNIKYAAKFGGATGNFNAHYAAYPDVDWISFARRLVNEVLGLDRSEFTTQIEHYDQIAALCDNFRRINTILTDLCRDMWTYISMDYFGQKIREGEVGSSAMPHKVNPIDFENAEGNLGVANALFSHFSEKLPVSRLQRDLTDSTVLRNVGVPFAHTFIALKSLEKGFSKVILNKEKLHADLDQNWAVVAEGIQTILRREGFPKPYEALKELTRGNNKIDKKAIHSFIDTLKVSDSVKSELKALTPFNYTGISLY